MMKYARATTVGAVTLLLLMLLLLPITRATRFDRPGPKQQARPNKSARLRPTLAMQDTDTPTPVSSQAVGFAVSLPLAKLEQKHEPSNSMRFGKAEANKERPEKVISPALSGLVDFAESLRPRAVAMPELAANSPTTVTNFEGLSSQDNADVTAVGAFVFPPDTIGDVGPTQYVQATNLLFRVFDKTGVPLTEKAPISTLFGELGPPCSLNDDGDPIVLYDSLADRWIITQFLVSGPAPLSQCFAISRTGDASGSYFLYRFLMPNNKFNDYPKFAVWPDGYYLSNNQFNLAGTAFLGAGVFALDRAKLLAGDPTAGFIYFDLQSTHPRARGMLPSDADGLNAPPAGAPNVFACFNANEFAGDAGDSLRLFDFHADFAEPSNSTFTERTDSPLPVAAFNPLNPVGLDDIEQPAPSSVTSSLDSISDRLMHRLQYRNFVSYEALTTNHTVNVGAGNTLATHQAGIRYYELRRVLPNGVWTVREQGTFAPDTDNRWMGSSAMDNQGNLAVGYSISGINTFPGIRFAGRLVDDPFGGLFQGESTLIAGSGVQTNSGSRWGDYSSMSVDPTDDCTFWYAQEYYQTTDPTPATPPFGVNWQTRVGSFKFAECTAPRKGTLVVNVTHCASGLPVQGASINVDSSLYGSTQATGSNSSQHVPGSFSVDVSKSAFLAAAPTTVVITDGETTVLNICLIGLSVIRPVSAVLVNESCPPNNNAIDPDERVTFHFEFKNQGAGSTSNLVATLQPTGGVIAPSNAQTYGVVNPGDTIGRDFSFTASGLCGNTVRATLQLQDGENNLGAWSFDFSLGPVPLAQDFDDAAPPLLPDGWVTSQGANFAGFGPWVGSSLGTPSPVAVSLPNAAFTLDPNNVLDNRLDSPSIFISTQSTQLSFRQNFVLEENTASVAFDAAVLEISIGGRAFTDIIEAGGTFVQGGYNKTGIDPSFLNPLLPSRPNWSGHSGGFITTIVNLPQAAAGQHVVLRWRMGSDNSVSGQGWRIDSVRLIEATCTTPCGIVRLVVTSNLTRVDEMTVKASYRVQNVGTLMATAVQVTTARLGASAGTPLPQWIGDIEPGTYSSFSEVLFSQSQPGATSTTGLGGSYSNGTFNTTKRVVVP